MSVNTTLLVGRVASMVRRMLVLGMNNQTSKQSSHCSWTTRGYYPRPQLYCRPMWERCLGYYAFRSCLRFVYATTDVCETHGAAYYLCCLDVLQEHQIMLLVVDRSLHWLAVKPLVAKIKHRNLKIEQHQKQCGLIVAWYLHWRGDRSIFGGTIWDLELGILLRVE